MVEWNDFYKPLLWNIFPEVTWMFNGWSMKLLFKVMSNFILLHSCLISQVHSISLFPLFCILCAHFFPFIHLSPFTHLCVCWCVCVVLQLQEWYVQLTGRGLIPETEDTVSIMSVIGASASVTIPFVNPTDSPAALSVTLSGRSSFSFFFFSLTGFVTPSFMPVCVCVPVSFNRHIPDHGHQLPSCQLQQGDFLYSSVPHWRWSLKTFTGTIVIFPRCHYHAKLSLWLRLIPDV